MLHIDQSLGFIFFPSFLFFLGGLGGGGLGVGSWGEGGGQEKARGVGTSKDQK